MIKVKEFGCYGSTDCLNDMINNFLGKNKDIEFIDIKYSIGFSNNRSTRYALLIYKEKGE